jgi:hypothetical protein
MLLRDAALGAKRRNPPSIFKGLYIHLGFTRLLPTTMHRCDGMWFRGWA